MKTRILLSYCMGLLVSVASVTESSAQNEPVRPPTPVRVLGALPAPSNADAGFNQLIYNAANVVRGNPTLTGIRGSRFVQDVVATKAMNDSNKKIAAAIKRIKKSESDGDKAQFKKEIQTELENQYDTYLTQHEKPLLELEKRLATLREEFESRKLAKEDLVKLRLDTIWYDALGIGWPNRSVIRGFPNNNLMLPLDQPYYGTVPAPTKQPDPPK